MKRAIDAQTVQHVAAMVGLDLPESELTELAGELSYFIGDISRTEVARDTEPAFTFQPESLHGRRNE
jgi:Asp-tRNA(Asn)/Glu-tRNA(Gln) amidotransferase C subunit